MKRVLHVLIVEDSEDDTRLLVRFLKRNGYEVVYERVDTAEAMQAALHNADWDLIIADYRMPLFSGIEALKIAKDSQLDLPFIIMSGVIGEETAVAAMRAGAHDYLMKDNLTRLIPAIERELNEATERRARKRLEVELRQYMTRLEQMVEERTAELVQARDEALVALRFKNQLLNNLNHEIRTPLSVINIKVNLLSRGHYGPISDSQNLALTTIYDEAQTLLTLMENLLEVSKLEADPTGFQRSRFSPADLIEQVFPKLLPAAQAKGLALKYDITGSMVETIRGDLNQLRRILFNLVDNAIKFTDQGEVFVRFSQSDSQHWVMQVTDTGIGIPASTQEHIFEPFWQADHSSEHKVIRGVGLGLPVVQKLVHLMEGEIQITSDGQSGTTFTVTLPFECPPQVFIDKNQNKEFNDGQQSDTSG